MRPSVVFHVDRFVAPGEERAPRIAIDDPGYLLGDGVFATLRARDGVPFRLDVHLDRLARGAELFGFSLPLPVARVGAIAREAAERTGERDAYVRLTATRAGARGPDATRSTLTVLARRLDVPALDVRSRGIRVGVAALRRPPRECADPYVKTTSYAGSVLARREAEGRGWDEALQLAVDGSVACASMANVFVVHGRRVTTPGLASGCRAGVTRALVLDLARAHGFESVEERVSTSELASADEVFLTSTRVGCLPVASLDGLGDARRREGPFPVTLALDEALERCVTSETSEPPR